MPLNIVYWIILSPFSRAFSCGRPLRITVCGGKRKAKKEPSCCARCCLSFGKKCCCRCCVRRCEIKKTAKQLEYRPTTCDAFLASTVLIMYMMLPSIWRICFLALQSYRIGNQLYASIDLEHRWFEGNHLTLSVLVALPSLLVYAVVLPTFIFFKLKHIDRTLPRIKFTYGFLYIGYRKERWWWEGELQLSVLLSAVVLVVA